MLGADARIVIDGKQRCSLAGCYAAGDAVTGINQIAVAMVQGEIAAVDIHNRLREREGRCVAPVDEGTSRCRGRSAGKQHRTCALPRRFRRTKR
jgi:hypothetical protein